MLQTGRSRVQDPNRLLSSFSLLNPSSGTKALGLTQPLTGRSARESTRNKNNISSEQSAEG
jgi:hypothetical protein